MKDVGDVGYQRDIDFTAKFVFLLKLGDPEINWLINASSISRLRACPLAA